MIETHRATTAEELEAVYRFRYSVYVEEMGRYQATADHAGRRLVDPEDAHSWNFYALDEGRVIASNRVTWGGHGFSERQIEHYRLAPFLAELPAETMAVGERTMVAASHRGSTVGTDMANGATFPTDFDAVAIVFGACEPHLISFYAQLGTVPYAARNINSEASGYVIPVLSLPEGADPLRRADGSLPNCMQAVLDNDCAVASEVLLGADDYWQQISPYVRPMLDQPLSFFAGFTPDEVQRCLARSSVIACADGDQVIRRGGTAHNLFVVLSGGLEARDGRTLVGTVGPGDVFGETAFLLNQARSLDVVAVDGSTRVLALSERVLRALTAVDAALAAKVFANLSKQLCARATASGRATAPIGG